MKTVIIGDVHGCYREMMEILEKIGPAASDQVCFVGDLINKGPDSQKVVREIRKNKFQCVLGNHEWSYLKRLSARRDDNPFTPFYSPKKHPLLDVLLDTLTEEENHWIRTLPLYIDTPDFLLVHAGIYPLPLPEHTSRQLLSVRTIGEKPWHDLYAGEKLIVYGHWALQGLKVKENSIGLDTGCVYGKELSALILPERKIVQVPSTTSAL